MSIFAVRKMLDLTNVRGNVEETATMPATVRNSRPMAAALFRKKLRHRSRPTHIRPVPMLVRFNPLRRVQQERLL
jgi:hypothetical protein